MKAVLAQLQMELRLTIRRGENLFVTLVVPVALLLFFASVDIFSVGGRAAVSFLVPGIITLAIMAAGLVSLGIATAYERAYGVLKRLGGTPLTRLQLMVAKIGALLVVEIVQLGLIIVIASLLYSWRPAGGIGLAVLLALLGTVTFAGLGLALAGSLRAETTLALANGLFLLLMLTGGLFLPLTHLPELVAAIAPFLPSTALAELLRAAFDGAPLALGSLLVLVAWTAMAVIGAALTFQWE